MELPYELVGEILVRVPVKYILRCRCVSKGWCSVIDSTEFVKKHLNESIETNRVGVIVQGSAKTDSGKRYLLADLESFDDGSAVVDISEEVKGILNGARLIGSVNGLVCLSMSGGNLDSFFLLNPCTRKCKKLPTAGTEFLVDNNLESYFTCGFGYDHVSDDYKVVMMGWCKNTCGIMAIVYSLKKNSWTPNPNVFTTGNMGIDNEWGICLDGALLWKAVDLTSMNTIIVEFDLGSEQFMEAKYCNGNVLLMDITVENSRAKEMSANPVFMWFRSPRLLTYSKSLEKILLEVDHERFVWYHFRSREFQDVRIHGIPNWFVSRKYIESLVSLIEDRQPSLEAQLKKQQPKKRFSTVLLVVGSLVVSLVFLLFLLQF